MTVNCIYGEIKQHEIWKCECKEGIFYVDALQGYKVVHWNYPEIIPNQELLEKAKTLITKKKNKRKINNERKINNADRIRNMSNRELAEFIYNVSNNLVKISTCGEKCAECEYSDGYCTYMIGEWLISESDK